MTCEMAINPGQRSELRTCLVSLRMHLRPSENLRALPMRILAVTNMYPSSSSPGQGVFVQEQIKGLRSIGMDVRVLFVDRRREGPMAYYRLQSKVGSAVTEFKPDAIHVMYGGVMADQIVYVVTISVRSWSLSMARICSARTFPVGCGK